MNRYVLCGLFFVAIGFVAGWACDWFFGDNKEDKQIQLYEEKENQGDSNLRRNSEHENN